MNALSALTRFLSRASLIFSAAGLIAMTAIIGWQVFGRFVLGESPAWSEQAALVLMVWYITIAAAVGVREGFHIRLTALVDSLPPGAARVVDIVAFLAVMAVGAVMALWGAELAAKTWAHAIPSLPLTRGVAYLPIPIAGVLIMLFSLEHILVRLNGKTVEPLWS
jgi:TRAP-type C4-dicarboxylate transport system permease small subunit